jgi:CHAT domain-containing protein
MDEGGILLVVLANYPEENRRYLPVLSSKEGMKKIAIGLLEAKVENVTVGDFELVDRSGFFLFSCGLYLLRYGADYGRADFVNLAVDLFDKGKTHFEKKAHSCFRALMIEYIKRRTLGELGEVAVDNLLDAIRFWEKDRSGLALNMPGHASCLMIEGMARRSLAGLGVDAVNNLRKAIRLHERARKEGFLKNTRGYAAALMDEGIARQRLASLGVNSTENLRKAIRLHERARKEGLLKNTRGYARDLMDEGVARWRLARLGVNSTENLRKAIRLHERARKEGFLKNTRGYAAALMDEGIARQTFARLGVNSTENLRKAIRLHERARKEGFLKNTPNHAKALMNEGDARHTLANFGIGAVDNLRKAIRLHERARKEGFLKNTPNYAMALKAEGNARRTLAGFDIGAVDNLRKAIRLHERARKEGLLRNTPSYAGALMDEGAARRTLAEYGVDSVDNLRKAIRLHERARKEGFARNTLSYAGALLNEGNARRTLAVFTICTGDNLRKAIRLHERARKEGFIGNRLYYASSRVRAEGNARRASKEFKKRVSDLDGAETLLLEAKRLFAQMGVRTGLIKVNHSIGALKCLSNQMLEAYGYFKESINLVEQMRASIEIPELRKEYLETVDGLYRDIVLACIALKKYDEAFRYAESARARAFVELLARKRRRIRGHSKLVEHYRTVIRRVSEIEKEKMSLRRKSRELERLRNLSDNLLREIKQNDLQYYRWKTAEPIELDELLEALKGKTLVEYFLGEKLVIFVVKRARANALRVKVVDIDEDKVLKKIARFKRLVGKIEKKTIWATGPTERAQKILKDLYKLLIEPIKEFDLSQSIVIVPHGYLHFVPFQALSAEKYLIEDHEISFARSATSLKFSGGKTGSGALVIGDPMGTLSFARDEAIQVARLLGATPILGSNAEKNIILKKIRGKEILHFACGGLFDPSNPAFSRIRLSGGSITAAEFMDLDMAANLTVLSACETGLGRAGAGDEVEGLTGAIQCGGSRFVIASLWKVDDKSTKELFLRFYAEEGDVVSRFRKAILSLIEERGYGFFYWAPFQIYGV